MKIKSVKRSSDLIEIVHTTNAKTGEKEFAEKAHDAPLPAFDTALKKLAYVIADVMDLPGNWCKDIIVTKINLTYTVNGTRSAVIFFNRPFFPKKKKLKGFQTPSFQFDQPSGDEKEPRECNKTSANLVEAFLKQAIAYKNGERLEVAMDIKDDDNGSPGQNVIQFEDVKQQIESMRSKKNLINYAKEKMNLDLSELEHLKLAELKREALASVSG